MIITYLRAHMAAGSLPEGPPKFPFHYSCTSDHKRYNRKWNTSDLYWLKLQLQGNNVNWFEGTH